MWDITARLPGALVWVLNPLLDQAVLVCTIGMIWHHYPVSLKHMWAPFVTGIKYAVTGIISQLMPSWCWRGWSGLPTGSDGLPVVCYTGV